jgi:hypothetical protein
VALRGVCIAPGRHLTAEEQCDLPSDSTLQFLLSINAVKVLPDEPPPPAPESATPKEAESNSQPKGDEPSKPPEEETPATEPQSTRRSRK